MMDTDDRGEAQARCVELGGVVVSNESRGGALVSQRVRDDDGAEYELGASGAAREADVGDRVRLKVSTSAQGVVTAIAHAIAPAVAPVVIPAADGKSVNQRLVAFVCDHVGVSGTTRVHVRRIQRDVPAEGVPAVFEARVGIAVLGQAAETTTDDSDPFAVNFRDNFARGYGTTPEQALAALRRDVRDTADSLWA